MDKGNINAKQSDTLRRIIISLLIFVSIVSPVMARSSTEIGQDIINKQQEILENERRLAESAANKKYYETESANLAEGVPKLEAQIKELEEELNGIKLEISILEQQQKLKELEREQTQFSQNETIKGSYMDWKSTSHDVRMFIDEDIDFVKIQQYQSAIAGNQKESIINLTNELVKIDGEMSVLSQKKKELDTKQAEVTEQKRQLEERLAQLQWGIANAEGNIGALSSAINEAHSQISVLSEQQRAAFIREQEILQNNPGVVNSAGCDGTPVPENSFYICGNGRDAPQGHGVGMSHSGIQGAGQKGVAYSNMLLFYYPGSVLTSGYEGGTVTVDGYGVRNVEDYVAGQGEVPSRACGSAAQAAARPDKYTTSGYCWPEESIKAQAIAFRTYGLRYGWVYNDDRSQLYNGTQNTKWAADETRGVVLTYGGNVIDAMYSSDNSQGSGTADCGTRFQNVYGVSNYGCYPYLVSVNDNAWAWDTRYYYPDYCGSALPCGLWPWKTRTYTYAEFDSFLTWVGTNLYWEFGAAKNQIGNTTYITFDRDLSGRIKKINILGTNGIATLGGWWFKNAWISWTATIGQNDYIYSQTLNVVQN